MTPVTLSEATLDKLSPDLRTPSYDRSQVREGIVHLGVGGFHRAHQALYIERILEELGEKEWGICGVGIMPHDSKMREALTSQQCLYTLVEKGDGEEAGRVIGAMKSYLYAPKNPEKVFEKLASPETKIVSLTVTEGGYYFDQGTGELLLTHPEVAHDLANPKTPHTIYGYLVEGLARRRAAGVTPFTVLSCDNIQANGEVTKRLLVSYALKKDAELARWIEENVAFPNSMVDRITPITTPEDIEFITQRFGVKDQWPVVCEPFIQWVVEDKFCNGRPSFEKVGVEMTSDVHPYEKMKIRLLNASHSAMGYLGYLAGFRYIFEITRDEEFGKYVARMMDEEVTPLLDPVPGIDLPSYKKTLLIRFANPNVKDHALRICMDGSAKMPKFILPSIKEQLEKGGNISLLTLVVASWFRFLTAEDEEGREIPIQDPMAAELVERAKRGKGDPTPLLEMTELFGDLGKSEKFVAELRRSLDMLYSVGARKTLQSHLS